MRAFSSNTALEQSTASNRRQPVRQTRTNPPRTSTNVALANNVARQSPDGANDEAPGFFPAITHFTDSITALPKEMIRHYTMLKEVDAKIYGPEEKLGQLLNAGLKMPGPNPAEAGAEIEPLPEPHHPDFDHPRFARQKQFFEMRREMAGLLLTLDEKNHVMNTAIDGLEKQLKRCQSSYPHIEDEISEEARLGSMTHWAYNTEKPTEKKGMMAGERTRRAVNHFGADGDVTAIRSEARRDAIAARKGRNATFDSDFDDTKAHSKKAQNGSKGRKSGDAAYGLGISHAAGPPSKRRKMEKPGIGGFPMERAISSVYGSSARGASPALDGAGKKKARGGGVTASNGRKRGNTNAAGLDSPLVASSPVIGTFTASSKDRQGRSPVPSALPRVPSGRARQNSSQSGVQLARNRSSSTTTHRATNGNGLYNTTTDVEKVSGLTGRSAGDMRSNMKDSINAKGEHMIEEASGGDGAADMRGALLVGNKNTDKSIPTENGNGTRTQDRPPSISVSTRGSGAGGGGNDTRSKPTSKNPTPLTASFTTTESSRSRPPRSSHLDLPAKRSHKKGAGIAAQLAAAAAAAAKRQKDDEGSSMQEGEEDMEDGDGDGDGDGNGGDEPRYCYCNEVSYGEMVGCDADDCPREWFHLDCVGLSRAPAKNVKWYCDECKENSRRR